MGELKMWHLMLVGGILGGLILGVQEALAYVDRPAAFVFGLFLGGFVAWCIVSAVLIVFRFLSGHSTTHPGESQQAQPR